MQYYKHVASSTKAYKVESELEKSANASIYLQDLGGSVVDGNKIISEHRRLLNYSIIELFIYTTFHACIEIYPIYSSYTICPLEKWQTINLMRAKYIHNF